MKKLLLLLFLAFCCTATFGQTLKTNKELRRLNATYKRIHYDEVSDSIDAKSDLETIVDSGYIIVKELPQSSPIHKMLDYFRMDIATLDSFDLSKGDSSNLYSIHLEDSIFYKNTYYAKGGKLLKLVNVVSVPYLRNEAYIYYHHDKPFKIFWSRHKEPYLGVESFYYFKGKNISDNNWEDFKCYSPFEYRRAINFLEEFKKKSKDIGIEN